MSKMEGLGYLAVMPSQLQDNMVVKMLDLHLVTVPYFGIDNYKATYIGIIVPVRPPDTWLSPESLL